MSAKAEAKPNKLAIGGEGGFQVGGPKYDIEKTRSLVIMPEIITIPLPCPQLPELVLNAINGIIVRPRFAIATNVPQACASLQTGMQACLSRPRCIYLILLLQYIAYARWTARDSRCQ